MQRKPSESVISLPSFDLFGSKKKAKPVGEKREKKGPREF